MAGYRYRPAAAVVVMLAWVGMGRAVAGGFASPDAEFAGANELYKAGRFGEAVLAYERLARAGFRGAHLDYNLGNAYYRSGDAGKAVVHYERALLLAPRDADVLSNYAFLRTQHGLPEPSLAGPRFAARLDRFGARVGVNALAAIFSSAFFLAFAALAARLFQRDERPRALLLRVCAVCCVAALCGGSLLLLRARYVSRAAAVLREGNALFAPLESATEHFSLAPGNIVEVLESSGAYAKVRRADGRIGWVKSGTLEKIL